MVPIEDGVPRSLEAELESVLGADKDVLDYANGCFGDMDQAEPDVDNAAFVDKDGFNHQDHATEEQTRLADQVCADQQEGKVSSMVEEYEECQALSRLREEKPELFMHLTEERSHVVRLNVLEHLESYIHTYCIQVLDGWKAFQHKSVASVGHLNQMSLVKHPDHRTKFFHWLNAPHAGRIVNLDHHDRPIWPVSSVSRVIDVNSENVQVIEPAVEIRCQKIKGPGPSNPHAENLRPKIVQYYLDLQIKCESVLQDGSICQQHPRCMVCDGTEQTAPSSCVLCMCSCHSHCMRQVLQEPDAYAQISKVHEHLRKVWNPTPQHVQSILMKLGTSLPLLCECCSILLGSECL